MSQPVPIFVDDTGRRRRLVRRIAMVATSLALAYVVVLAATLVGLPGLGRLPLPGVADLRVPADTARTSVGDRTVEERLPDLTPPPPGAPAPTSTTTTATPPTSESPTTADTSPPSTSPATTSAPTTTVTTTTVAPGRGGTTTTAVPPGRGSTTTTAPGTTSTTNPGRRASPPSTAGPR